MPWTYLTLRSATLTKKVRHALMARLTDALTEWKKRTLCPRTGAGRVAENFGAQHVIPNHGRSLGGLCYCERPGRGHTRELSNDHKRDNYH